MNSSTIITSVLSKVDLHHRDLEDVINFRFRNERFKIPDTGVAAQLRFRDLEPIMTCGAEMPVKGNLHITFSASRSTSPQSMEVPIYSKFFMTCIKIKGGRYEMSLSSSLS
jgi:hypothetical protein